MSVWINSHQLAESLSVTWTQAKRIIASRAYKKQPLIVRQEKSKKGKPSYFVLWNTTENKPATEENDHALKSTATAIDTTAICTTQPNTAPDASIDAAPKLAARKTSVAKAIKSNASTERQTASIPQENALATIVQFPVKPPELEPESSVFLTPLIETDEQRFERLLANKVREMTAQKAAVYRYKARLDFKANGIIPKRLELDFDKSARTLSGRKCTLPPVITERFIELVKASADIENPKFKTQKNRKVSNFLRTLQDEFRQSIELAKLYSLVKKHDLRHYLERPDQDDGKVKEESFWPAIPVGDLVMMDGCESDFIYIRNDKGEFKPFRIISLADVGARYFMAGHCYFSESSANSVDLFQRFLKGNRFVNKPMEIRPDQAGGFLNLARPITALNNKYATTDGFVFLFKPARAATPLDKAHLESAWRYFHNYEDHIINKFSDRIVGRVQKKKIGKDEYFTVTQLDITLDELNQSGLIENYINEWNGHTGKFREEGKNKKWIPLKRWQDEYLSNNDRFHFSDDDIESIEIYGLEKRDAKVSKSGTITYKGQTYQVLERDRFGYRQSTPIKYSVLSDGSLAVFGANKGEELICKATLLTAPNAEKSKAIKDKNKAEILRIQTGNLYHTIVSLLKEHSVINIDEKMLRGVLADGLDLELANWIFANPKTPDRFTAKPLSAFNYFCGDAKRELAKRKSVAPFKNAQAN